MEVRAQEMGILRREGDSSLHSTFEDSLSYLNFVYGVGGRGYSGTCPQS